MPAVEDRIARYPILLHAMQTTSRSEGGSRRAAQGLSAIRRWRIHSRIAAKTAMGVNLTDERASQISARRVGPTNSILLQNRVFIALSRPSTVNEVENSR